MLNEQIEETGGCILILSCVFFIQSRRRQHGAPSFIDGLIWPLGRFYYPCCLITIYSSLIHLLKTLLVALRWMCKLQPNVVAGPVQEDPPPSSYALLCVMLGQKVELSPVSANLWRKDEWNENISIKVVCMHLSYNSYNLYNSYFIFRVN